jgi:hypothetical protein
MSYGFILGLVLCTTLLFFAAMNQLFVLVMAAKSMAAVHVNLSVLNVALDSVAMVGPSRRPTATIGEMAA